ncbi:MAG: hypothetical protein D6699_05140, partial [Aquificota bacterium]
MGKIGKCETNLSECMKLKSYKLIHAFKINDEYIIGIYKGKLSQYDIIIKYRQRTSEGWSK